MERSAYFIENELQNSVENDLQNPFEKIDDDGKTD